MKAVTVRLHREIHYLRTLAAVFDTRGEVEARDAALAAVTALEELISRLDGPPPRSVPFAA